MLLEERIKIKSTNVDLLKFISAASVILCHSYAITQNRPDFVEEFTRGACNLGGLAVAVFFFLSGLYVRKSQERTPEAADFMKRRCRRIFPQLWTVVLLSMIAGAFLTEYALRDYLTDKGTYLYLLNGLLIPVHDLPGVFLGMPYRTVNGQLWTMPVEFACYVGLAVLAVLAGSPFGRQIKTDRTFWDAFAFVMALLMFAIVSLLFPGTMLITIVRPVVVFFEGALFYDLRDRISLRPALGLAMIPVLFIFAYTPLFNFAVILLLPYGVLAVALGLPQIRLHSIITKCTYEMYLMAWPIQQTVEYILRDVSPIENFLITLPLDTLMGVLLYLVIDKHSMSRSIERAKGKKRD